MSKPGRTFLIVLLAAFVVGTVAYAVSATSLALKILLAHTTGGNVEDCLDGTGDEGAVPVCDQVCVAPFVAMPVGTVLALPSFANEFPNAPLGDQG